MKKLLTLFGIGFIPLFLIAQTPKEFNYQAAVRGSNNELILNSDVTLKIEIIDAEPDTVIYIEEHSTNTGELGIVNLKIGLGVSLIGNFEQINWSYGKYKLRTSINSQELGTSDVLTVPIASGLRPQYSLSLRPSQSANDTESIFAIGGATPNGSLGFDYFGLYHFAGDNVNESQKNLWIYGVANRNMNVGIDNKLSVGHLWDGANQNGMLYVRGKATSKLIQLKSFASGYDTWISSFDENDDQMWTLNMGDRNEQNSFGLFSGLNENYVFRVLQNGNVGIGTNNPNQRLHVIGTTKTCILEITGGCDIKEDFNSSQKLQPGDVVIIDEKNPGELKLTNKEYDKKVAGVISGANGVNHGISLSQEGILDGEYPLTMLGRVYVKVTGKVEIGDMLTTSSKAGYAMAVKDFSKANGTVIGKAMTANEEGEGLVLVLVNLQ